MVLLDTTGGNPKLAKSTARVWSGFKYAGLTLYPDAVLCAGSKAAGCMPECLRNQGRGNFDSVTDARQRRADWFYSDPVAFLTQLKGELEQFERACLRAKKTGVVRLNVLQDVDWENYGVPQAFPRLHFLDYTKRANRLGNVPDNYRLIWSWSGRDQFQRQNQVALDWGGPIAVVFRGGLPHEFLGRPVIDGDLSDIGNAAAEGCIVGLRAKGTAARDASGFVIDNPDLIAAA
ncbi:MAG: Puniceispirillum phage [Pseudomonadota bacterium]|jgi:hypothetical protein